MSGSIEEAKKLKEKGNEYYYKKDYQNALEYYSRAIKLNPNCWKSFNNRGLCYDYMGKYNLAITEFKVALGINPKWVSAYFSLCVCFHRLGNLNESRKYYEEGMKFEPTDSKSFFNRGLNLSHEFPLELQDLEKGIEDFSCSIQLYSPQKLARSLYELYFNRGLAYGKFGDHKSAILDFSTSIDMEPNNPSYYWERSRSYKNLGKYEKEKDDLFKFKELLKVNSNNPKYFQRSKINDGIILNRLGNIEKTEKAW